MGFLGLGIGGTLAETSNKAISHPPANDKGALSHLGSSDLGDWNLSSDPQPGTLNPRTQGLELEASGAVSTSSGNRS